MGLADPWSYEDSSTFPKVGLIKEEIRKSFTSTEFCLMFL